MTNLNEMTTPELLDLLKRMVSEQVTELTDGVGFDEFEIDDDGGLRMSFYDDATGEAREVQLQEFTDFQREQQRMHLFELSHVQPQDNVWEWFRTSITEATAYPDRYAQGWSDNLAEGWRTLHRHGIASPQLDEWFDRATAGLDGPIGGDYDPRVGAVAHSRSITHYSRFEREFGGDVDGPVSENIARAVERRALAGYLERVDAAAAREGVTAGHTSFPDYDWSAAMREDIAPHEAFEDAQFKAGAAHDAAEAQWRQEEAQSATEWGGDPAEPPGAEASGGDLPGPAGGSPSARADHPLHALMAATQLSPTDRRNPVENPYELAAPAAASSTVQRAADTVER